MSGGKSPLLIAKNEIAFGQNLSLRGGYAQPRNPLQIKTLNFNGNAALQSLVLTGGFQGAGYYRPDSGTESLIAQISGHLIKFTENGNGWVVTDISIPGDLNDPTVQQVWMWQAEKWLIVQDGTGKLPIFYDGNSSRRSYGPSMILGTTAADFTPPAIGSSVSLTLAAPYTGPYNVPVILNGEFYQPVQVAGGYSVVLTNVQDTPGHDVPVNTAVVIQPGTIGVVVGAQPGGARISGNPNPGSCGSGNHIFDCILSSTTGLTAGHFSIPGSGSPAPIGKLVTLNGFRKNGGPQQSRLVYVVFCDPVKKYVSFQDAVSEFGCFDVVINSTVIDQSNTSPNVIIGYTTADFLAPAVGVSINTILTQPYTGNDGQVVYLNSQAYTIANPPPPPASTTLIVINLTDNSTSNVAHPKNILSVPEIPAGRNGAYGMGCNCCVLTDGISYIIGDVVGSGAGTQANNYRDAVLKVTQNDFLLGGGYFRLPGTGDVATAVIFPPNLDTSLGQGPLQIGTPFSFFTNVVPGTDPSGWPALTTPIQTESLKDNGAMGQNSTISVNSDTFFRSPIGIGSLVLARRAFQGWGNKPISYEVNPLLDKDNQNLLQYSSAISFTNRFQCTLNPLTSPNGVLHRGLVSLNFELISTLRETLPPAWEGLQTGLNIFQVISGRVNGSLRAFAFSYNYITNTMEIYEFLSESSDQFLDNGVTPIVWAFETAVLFNADVKNLNELVQLRDGEIYLSDIQGAVHVDVYYRPDFYPCWTKWNGFDVCESDDASNSKPGYRMRIGLGQPSPDACEIANNRPLRNGYFFQFRIVVSGQCVFKGMRVKAVTTPQPDFAKIICDTESCQVIDCDLPDPYALYSLQGNPPVVAPPSGQDLPFANELTVLSNYCANGLPYYFGTNLPPWITVDSANNRITGAAGMFRGATQDEANAAGVAGLMAIVPSLNILCGFYNTQQTVTCADHTTQSVPAGTFFSQISQADADNQAIALAQVQCADPSCSGTDTGKYKIVGYYDGMFFGGGDPAQPGDVPWDGTFKFKNSGCEWDGCSPRNAGTILINNTKICAFLIFHSSPDFWYISINDNKSGNNCFETYSCQKAKGSSPAGVYTRASGSLTPLTVTVVPIT